ncbi:hypothetical protein QN277_005559 [Acacia crassicarpa]|uniref:Non-haem dioxygenase N-terminal domain-containing protein n=1 Tax=Acacia crassicarpa TaxID=499986 RepID=A0AAE1IXE1_9FABA|nr:hypothetical protein QN277_005559 [Acacia crassicarpa]
MVVPCRFSISHFILRKQCTTPNFKKLPEIDLSDPQAKTHIVKACKDFGFLKIINHDISLQLITDTEAHTENFLA